VHEKKILTNKNVKRKAMNEREKSQKSAKVAVGNDLQMRRVLFEELRK